MFPPPTVGARIKKPYVFSSGYPGVLRSSHCAATSRSRGRSCCVQGVLGFPPGAPRARVLRVGFLARISCGRSRTVRRRKCPT
eukprot:5647135-Pyramimonas_sp.AAC.1